MREGRYSGEMVDDSGGIAPGAYDVIRVLVLGSNVLRYRWLSCCLSREQKANMCMEGSGEVVAVRRWQPDTGKMLVDVWQMLAGRDSAVMCLVCVSIRALRWTEYWTGTVLSARAGGGMLTSSCEAARLMST